MKILVIAAVTASVGATMFNLRHDSPRRAASAAPPGRPAVAAPANPAHAAASVAPGISTASTDASAPSASLTRRVARPGTSASRNVARRTEAPPAPADVFGVRPIELTADELAKLGIRAVDDGAAMVWYERGTAEPFAWAVTSRGMVMPADPASIEGLNVPEIMPAMITDDRGTKRAFITDDESIDGMMDDHMTKDQALSLKDSLMGMKMRTGRLVPLMVRAARERADESGTTKGWRPDCILWYEPTPELLASLPERVRTELKAEIVRAASMVEHEKLIEENPEQAAGRSSEPEARAGAGERPYLDILRSASGSLASTSIVPNPAADHATLSYRLSAPRAVSVSLHDITGRLLRIVAPAGARPPGISELTVDTGDLAEGMYLVVVSTDKGERAVQRLVVRK